VPAAQLVQIEAAACAAIEPAGQLAQEMAPTADA